MRARASIPPELLSSLRNLIESASGVVLGDAKLPHLSAVVRGRMAALGIPDAPGYMAFLSEEENGAAERRDLVSELLVGETSFFRTPALFQAFEKAILPGLLEQGPVVPLSIWCAGCATGEEAYSVAIAALEESRGRHAVPVRVRATDLHPRFIDTAREGIYPAQALRNLPGRIRETWFTPMEDGRYRVADAVRRLVDFEEMNLIDFLSDPLPSRRYAAIFCRNVMIYFRSDTTRRLVERFHESLLDGGVLFLGHSETLWGISEAFRLEQREKIFYYRKPRAESVPLRRRGSASSLRCKSPVGERFRVWSLLLPLARSIPLPRWKWSCRRRSWPTRAGSRMPSQCAVRRPCLIRGARRPNT